MKQKITIDLPFEEGKTYQTKFATGEKFLLNKIVYRKKNLPTDPDVIVKFEGVYENSPTLGNCPIAPERLIPYKEIIEKEYTKDLLGFIQWLPHSGYVTWDEGKTWQNKDVTKRITPEKMVEIFMGS